MNQTSKFHVTGTDDLDDVHIYVADDRQRAEQVAEVMRDDLEPLELVEKEA